MKKIGIVTFHRAYNYGAMLQAYALQKKCNEKNNSEIIDYYNYEVYSEYNTIRPLRKNIAKSSIKIFLDLINIKKRKEREKSFIKFLNEKLVLSKKYSKDEELKNEKLNYDVIITGSDQVWSPAIVGELSDIYTLNFDNDKIKRISYAASIGDISQIDKYKDDFIKKISKIDNISVREENAKKKLESVLNKQVDTVLDPTLLLSKEEWDSELKELTKPKEKYILAYTVSMNKEYIKIVNYLSKKTGLKVIHFGEIKHMYENVLKSCYTEGPLEFINYIKNAEYVVATSFHATVFSIIFNKNFFIVPHRKTGSRVTNLLNKLNINNRLFYSLDEFKNTDINTKTDWESVKEQLNKEKEKSIKWLENAIENGK
jgi:hypothetical protein